MIRYTFILLTIFLFSCKAEKNKQIHKNEKSTILNLITNNQNTVQTQNKRGKVFFSIDPECPLCRSYSKTINELYKIYQDSLDFYAFLPSPIFSKEKTDFFIEKYQFQIPLIVDTNQIITSFLDSKITPECFLVDNNINILYQGLIDDWIKEIGRKSQNIESKYLNQAIISYLRNDSIIIKKTNAIGCIIERFK